MKSKTLRSLAFASVLLCFLGSARAAFFDPKLKWQTLSTQHFNIHFHNGEEDIAYRMAGITEKVYSKLSPKLEWKPWLRTEVVLVDNTDAANAMALTLPYNYVLLYVTSPDGSSSLNYYENWLEDLFTHEFTHILHIDKYGGIATPFRWILGKIVMPNGLTPGWVREGIAVYEESVDGRGRNNNSFSDMMLRTDILNDQFLPIDQASGHLIDWPSAQAPYIYGGAFWQYLADTYGPEKITEFITRYGDSMWLFSLNNKARKTYNDKNFLKLWREWKESLQAKYQKVQADVQAKGPTSLNTLVHIDGILQAPTISPDGKKIAYSRSDKNNPVQLRLYDLATKEDIQLYKGRGADQISFSPDGKKIAFSTLGKYKYFNVYSDVYEVDLETKKLSVVTKGKRASDPDYSPDGKQLVFVENKLGSTQLHLYTLESKEDKTLTQAPAFTQFSNPRFSPDGKLLVVSAWMNGNRDIYLYDLEGKIVRQLTQDKAIDNEPKFSADGQSVYFTSDKSGISNIYKIDLSKLNNPNTAKWVASNRKASKRAQRPEGASTIGMPGDGRTRLPPNAAQETNVLTGLFYPQAIPGTNKYIAQHYFGRGYDIIEFDGPTPTQTAATTPCKGKKKSCAASANASTGMNAANAQSLKLPEPGPLALKPSEATGAESQAESLPSTGELTPKKYNPFNKLFFPRYIMPNVLLLDNTWLLSASTGNSDPLGRHIWSGDINYRSDAQFVGGDFIYTYNRWYTPFYAGFNDYVVNFGDVFRTNRAYFEEHKRVFGGVRLPAGKHKLDVYYYLDNRSDDKHVAGAFIPFLNTGNFAGFHLNYIFTPTHRYPASISPEGGPKVRLSLDISSTALGAKAGNQSRVFEADIREYVPLPWAENHVFALRAAGGWNFGDDIFQGVFRLGSATGEGVGTEYTPYLLTLRGLPNITFSGEGGMLFSGEYRLPLVDVQRGLGTGPIFLKNLHMAFFADYGTVFDTSPKLDEFLLGVGAELRGNFVIGYGLPITGRLGYGIIVKGRQFLGGLTDPLTQASIKNGTLILELGTSF